MNTEKIIWWGNMNDAQRRFLTQKYYPHLNKDHGYNRGHLFTSINDVCFIYDAESKNNPDFKKSVLIKNKALKWWRGLLSINKTQICDTNTELLGRVRRWETLSNEEIQLLYIKNIEKEGN